MPTVEDQARKNWFDAARKLDKCRHTDFGTLGYLPWELRRTILIDLDFLEFGNISWLHFGGFAFCPSSGFDGNKEPLDVVPVCRDPSAVIRARFQDQGAHHHGSDSCMNHCYGISSTASIPTLSAISDKSPSPSNKNTIAFFSRAIISLSVHPRSSQNLSNRLCFKRNTNPGYR